MRYKLKGDAALGKQDPLVVAIKERVDAMYEDGRTTVMSDEELEDILAELAPGRFVVED